MRPLCHIRHRDRPKFIDIVVCQGLFDAIDKKLYRVAEDLSVIRRVGSKRNRNRSRGYREKRCVVQVVAVSERGAPALLKYAWTASRIKWKAETP